MRLIGLAIVLGVFLAPLDVGAQQAQRVYRVGYLGSTPLTGPEMAPIWAAFIDTLRERGWVEGKNITIERRYAHGRVERFDELAIELVRLHVDVLIVASHSAALAARKAERRASYRNGGGR